MITRFCLYSIFKNLRFADPFFVLYLLALGRSFTEIGLLLGYQHVLTVCTEVPSGYLADRCGRRRSLMGCFFAYFLCYFLLGLTSALPSSVHLLTLVAALTSFGLAEAMRTGSHKAIMLDYLDVTGQSQRATEVIGLTRAWSKYSAGASALCGGLILFATQRFDSLFWLSAVPSAAGVVLMVTYPRYLDGECSRQAAGGEPPPDWRAGLWTMWSKPGVVRLLLQSVVYESQLELILKYYAQPIVKMGLARHGILLSAGSQAAVLERSAAAWIGCLEFIRESVGGAAARASRRLEQTQRDPRRALDLCYSLATALGLAVVGVSLWFRDWLWLAAAFFVLLTLLQNVRRPMFVSTLNADMEKSMRATVLSAESVARSLAMAAMLPVMGLVADKYGLEYALLLPAAVLVAAWPLRLTTPTTEPAVDKLQSATALGTSSVDVALQRKV
jgi:predicted MFS family arabinose efflux permease